MPYQKKTIQTKDPFEFLENEEKNAEQPLDFSLLDYQTLCYKNDSERSKTYASNELDVFDVEDFFVEEYGSITQEYKIEVYPKTQEKPFKIRLNTNADFTVLDAVLLSDENLSFYEGIKKDILELLFKQMIKEKFLILRLSKNLDNDLERLIKILKSGRLQREFEFRICVGVVATAHKVAEFVFHKKVSNERKKGGDSYDELGYCDPVKKGELLFEFVRERAAKAGRNLKGEYLAALNQKPSDDKNTLKFKDQSIYKEESESSIKYYAAFYGFFTYDSMEGYSISKVLKVESVELKTTGSIKADMNEDVSVEVLPNDLINDALKGGIVNIQASNVRINGNIGAAKITAKNLNISGGTHRESELTADTALINIHRGFLKAKTAYIEKLENARVVAESVYIKNSISSEIEADYIFVEELLSNNKLYPKKALVVEKLLKTGNLIHVTPVFVLSKNSSQTEYEDLKDLFLRVQNKLKQSIKDMENGYKFLTKNQSDTIKFKNLENKNELMPMQKNLLGAYERAIQKYNALVKDYKKFVNLYYQIYSKLELFKKFSHQVEVYIKAENIGQENALFFDVFGARKVRKKRILTGGDGEKLFFLNQEKDSIDFKQNYGENNIENIKAIFKPIKDAKD